MQNRLRQIKLVIYTLKNAYGRKGYLYQPSSVSNDYETGKMVTQYTITRIRKAVLLPADIARKYVFDLGYMAAAKNFTYGGLFDRSLRLVLLDASDVRGITLTLNDYFVYDSTKYKIKKLYKADDDASWLIQLQHIDATPDIIVPEFVVTGTPAGEYNQDGEYNDKPTYTDGTYWLWFHTDDNWYISATKGDIGGTFWGPNDEIQGTYDTGAEVVLVR